MKAIAVVPGTKTVRLVDRPEPSIAGPDEITLRVLPVGICGTDREEAAGGRAKAPMSYDDLVLGHEMFGQVADVGHKVTLVAPGTRSLSTRGERSRPGGGALASTCRGPHYTPAFP